MKEAAGELSMTAIAVVAIAAIGVVFTTLIWPAIKSNITRSTHCSQAHRCDTTVTAGHKTCYYYEEVAGTDGVATSGAEKSVQCPAN